MAGKKKVAKVNNEKRFQCTGCLSDGKTRPSAYIMPAETYEIIMIVDTNEPLVIAESIEKSHLVERRSLKVGSVVWIARSKRSRVELILPHIVERKKIDLFSSQIKDGWIDEVKLRLKNCRLNNVIYLLEDHPDMTYYGLEAVEVFKEALKLRVQDGFRVHRTVSLEDSIRFLDMMTTRLKMELKRMTLQGSRICSRNEHLKTFNCFNEPRTVKELFEKMLLGLELTSPDIVMAITKIYSSPKELRKAYRNCATKEIAKMLLADVGYDTDNKVGPTLSEGIYHLMTQSLFCSY